MGFVDATHAPPARATAFVPIWRRPWMSLAADTYGSSLLELAGITNVVGSSLVRYPRVDLAAVDAAKPDLVLLPSEPYAFAERHAAEVRDSVSGVRTVLIDGRDLFWWGIRTPAAAERLAEIL